MESICTVESSTVKEEASSPGFDINHTYPPGWIWCSFGEEKWPEMCFPHKNYIYPMCRIYFRTLDDVSRLDSEVALIWALEEAIKEKRFFSFRVSL